MNTRTIPRFLGAALAFASIVFNLPLPAHAQVETVLHAFSGLDGSGPLGGVISDHAGNLYGTTNSGGTYGWGTVFELSPAASGWTETVLHNFANSDGATPMAGLAMDSAGNLYGTTFTGGSLTDCSGFGCGEVFELSLTSSGWQFQILYSFRSGTDGGIPVAGVALDSAGNLYGTTRDGGAYSGCTQFNNGCGVVYKVSPTSSGAWKETVIHNFTGGWDGANPLSGLMVDAANNLYGMTTAGGSVCSTVQPYGCGVVYKLSPVAKGGWATSVLHTFLGEPTDGSYPEADLIADAAGNLYGTTSFGGSSDCELYVGKSCGTVFELSPNANGQWRETILHSFTSGEDGAVPQAPLIFDRSGNLFGETISGGRGCIGYGCGVVFEMKRTSSGGWKGVTLTMFTGGFEGGNPKGGLIIDVAGNLYGTASIGSGNPNNGLVLEITP